MTRIHAACMSMVVCTVLVGLLQATVSGQPREPVGLDSPLVSTTPDDKLVLAGRVPGSPPFDGERVFSVRPDGSELFLLSSDPGWKSAPVWSADGNRIAFGKWRGRDFDVTIVNGDGLSQRSLATAGGQNRMRDWTEIAFDSDWDPNVDRHVIK